MRVIHHPLVIVELFEILPIIAVLKELIIL